MKKFFTLLLALVSLVSADAQFYNYNSGNQQAYEWGRGMALYFKGQQAVYEGNYDEAYTYFDDAQSHGYIPAFEALGLLNELGISVARDTEWAQMFYEEGARKGDMSCRQALYRIANTGFYPESYKSQWLRGFRAMYEARNGGGGGYVPQYGDNVDDVDHSCRACNNTGVCNGCHGSGYAYDNVRCNMCHGSGKCMNCGGKGWR
ncbi:MAG: hypothetical protein UH625_01875 [Muribaculaceae bacterium]|nr:hypothetical protein [Muribaculaceae bacterium]